MEMFKIVSPLALSMSLFIAFALAAAAVAAGEGQKATATSADRASPEGFGGHFQHYTSADPSLRRVARALSANGGGGYDKYRSPPTYMTCDRHPKVCQAPGSPGPDCCGRRCVNIKTDSLNCGCCGKRCWYGSVCCKGKCVGLMYDRDNCGRCGNRCKKGSYCNYGMCSYGY
ncbi:hypothetical protein Taro_052185 [Colocasia esculenta]|uniref:Uncharacterized protein n=1 Tax=Colocasia esculenta TaxID=4460 RepID=A0A843XJ99_COLES|nr:hypothetical protein [Colocasia esculenta]